MPRRRARPPDRTAASVRPTARRDRRCNRSNGRASERPLRRQIVLLHHPRRPDRKQHRSAAAVGDRPYHRVRIDPGLERERYRLADRRGIDGDQQIVDELDLARGAERSEVKIDVGEFLHDRLERLAGFGVAGEIDRGLALRHHAGSAAHLPVEKDRTLGAQPLDLPLLRRQGMRAELGHDLAAPRRVDQPVRSADHLVEGIAAGEAGKDDVGLLADLCWRARRRAADLLEFRQGAAPVAEHAIPAGEQQPRDLRSDPSDPDQAYGLHWRSSRIAGSYAPGLMRHRACARRG